MSKSHRSTGLGSLPATVPQRKRPNVAKAGFTASRTSDEDWRHDAACRDEDPDLFFVIGNTGPALLQIEDAKAVCQRCPLAVVDACLAFALRTNQEAGVWGNTSEDERRALKRRAARARSRMS